MWSEVSEMTRELEGFLCFKVFPWILSDIYFNISFWYFSLFARNKLYHLISKIVELNKIIVKIHNIKYVESP